MKKFKILSVCFLLLASLFVFTGCGESNIYTIGSDVLKVEHYKGYTNYSVSSLTNGGSNVTAVVVIENKSNETVYAYATNWKLLTTTASYDTSDNSVIAKVLPNEKVSISVKFEIGTDDFSSAKLEFTFDNPKSIMKSTVYFVQASKDTKN